MERWIVGGTVVVGVDGAASGFDEPAGEVAGGPTWAGVAADKDSVLGTFERLQRANGVRTDLETALFRADHGIRLSQTVGLARAARRARPSIEGDAVLAWALARAGRCGEARGWSERALRLGTRDASKFFHRGMIERCLGRRAAARSWFRRALATNPPTLTTRTTRDSSPTSWMSWIAGTAVIVMPSASTTSHSPSAVTLPTNARVSG